MDETRNEALAEDNEKKLRANNLIIHGVAEPSGSNSIDNKAQDLAFVTDLIDTIRVTVAPQNLIRLGKSDANKKRPIKVILNSEEDKDKIMGSLKNLKDHEAFKGISVTDDYTLNERKLIKEKAVEAKVLNEKEAPDSKHVWRVRGTPKNGLMLKKLQKRKPATQI